MKTRSSLFVIAFVGAFAFASNPAFAQSPSRDDVKTILGVWKGGMPGDPPGSIELTITASKITGRNARTGKNLGAGTYDLDPAKGTIDAFGIENPVRGRTYYGVYSLEGNTLKWCANSRTKRRPADLTHRPDKDQWLMILIRQR